MGGRVDLSHSRQARAHRALSVGGLLLAVVYLAAWLGLGGKTAAPAPAARVEDDPARVSFEVRTSDGEQHLLRVPAGDPTAPLREAQALYGDDVSLRRVEAAEAAQLAAAEGTAAPWLALLALFPLAFAVAGALGRRRERQVASVFAALERTLSASAPQLERQTGLSRATLERITARIARRGWAELTWQADRVADARLAAQSLTLQSCPNCNEPTVVRIRADLSQLPRCSSCMSDYDRGHLARLVQEPVNALLAEAAGRIADQSDRFSTLGFGAMALLFPPAALVYAVRAAA